MQSKEKELGELRRELDDVKSRSNQLEDEFQQRAREERAMTPGSSRSSTPRKGSDTEEDSGAKVSGDCMPLG